MGDDPVAKTWDRRQLALIEDAALNASAPSQQHWMDGWLVRASPGKAKRARSINAVALGTTPLDERLARAAAVYREARLPMVVRITPFSLPADLDAALAARGYMRFDETWVMVRPPQPLPNTPPPLPQGLRWETLDGRAYAEAAGRLRGSSWREIEAHGERLRTAPVAYRGFALVGGSVGEPAKVYACGQFAREGKLVGLYDVVTAPDARNRGLSTWLCERMLRISLSEGAQVAYLQVDADNQAARKVYGRLGFMDAYRYHYRLAPDEMPAT